MAYGNSEQENAQASPLEQVIIWVRDDIIGELQAINQYQAHIDQIDDPEVKKLLVHVRDDEKEHVAELTHLLTRLDAMQQEKFAHDHTVADGEGVAAPAGEEDHPVRSVGSLFGKK